MKRILVVCAGLLAFVSPSFAVVNTWTGGASDGLWATAGNWDQGHAPTVGEHITIGDGVGVINLGGVTRSVGTVTVNLGNCTISNGVLGTAVNTTLIANGTRFAPNSGGLENQAGNALGNVTMNNVRYNKDQGTYGWVANQGKSMSLSSSFIDLVNGYLNVEGDSGYGPATLGINGGTNYVQALTMNNNWNYNTLQANVNLTNSILLVRGGGANLGNYGPATVRLVNSTLGTYAGYSSAMNFRSNAVLISDGGVLTPRGNFSLAMTNQAQWSGDVTLRHVTGLTARNFEVAGVDYGITNFNTAAGANYSLSRLQLGETGLGSTMTLVNTNDNNTGTAGTEALYVGTLELLASSTINLNGLNLYYQQLQTNSFSLTVNGPGGLFMIPEPTALALLMLAGLALWRRGAQRVERGA